MSKNKKEEHFRNALFDVEHALGMFAYSYCTLPAEAIYDGDALAPLMSVIDSCHIYIIGLLPRTQLVSARQSDRQFITTLSLLGKQYDLEWPLPDGANLHLHDGFYYVENENGQRGWLNTEAMLFRLSQEFEAVNFHVKYIGQAYGRDGSRNAIDRLLKHETLQQISLKGIPDGYRLSLLLLEIQPHNQLFTVFNPKAANKDESGTRIRAGIDKLFGTTEHERIALYEAALIRYFSPMFNKEFKNSFPSTNLKILQDCYAKDFSAVIAEICIDELPFRLCSEAVEASQYHIAKHDLHKDAARRIFFGL